MWLACAALAGYGHAARADAVMDWNAVALESVMTAKQTAPMTTHSMAMVHAAMFDAVNAIDQRYTPYRVKVAAEPGASSDAAAAAAAHLVLLKLFPDRTDELNRIYAPMLAQGLGNKGVAAGIRVGEQVAGEIIAWRATDGIGAPNTYRPRTEPGRYVPTVLPIAFDFARSTPWLMDRPDQFRPGPPPTLTSETWARDYNEIKELGGKSSVRRTPEQTSIALFWIQVGAPSWNPIVRQFAAAKEPNEVDKARLFALVYLAAADTLVAVFEAKYAFEFWRPVTAIRNGDMDGNDQTTIDPAWVPLADTPIHPEYPCAHCINAAAVGAVLAAEFGIGPVPAFTMTSATAPGVTRRWERISDYVDEVSNARVWCGVHYRTSTEVAKDMGRKIGEFAVRNHMAVQK